MCVRRQRQGSTNLLGQAFCSSAHCLVLPLPDPAKESIQGFKALMALIGRERKDMSTEGKASTSSGLHGGHVECRNG